MTYPTMEEVESANRIQLARWYRFLKSPGSDLGTAGYSLAEHREYCRKDKEILDRIIVRFTDLGGFTPAISKQIGWGNL